MADSILELINNAERLSPHRHYRIARGALGSTYLDLFSAPQADVVAVLAERPSAFASTDDTLADLGLPERMKDCLVYYACWQLLSQRIPLGLEELKVTQRQTEENDLLESQTQGGTETQTQTDNKTQTETGQRDSSVIEGKTGTQSEVIDLEQTDNKDGTLTTSGSETTTDVRTAATTGTTDTSGGVDKAHSETQSTGDDSHEWGTDTVKQTGTNKVHTSEHDTDENVYNTRGDNAGLVTEERDLTTTAEYDHSTPATQTGGSETGTVTTTTWQPEQTQKRDLRDHAFDVTTTPNLTETTTKNDYTGRTTTVNTNGSDQEIDRETVAKSETTSEDSQGTVAKNQTETSAENNITASSQEKLTTDNLQTETVTDEDTSVVTANTGTQTTELERDTTQQTTTTGGKVTSIETVNTFRDRLQAAQYYKMLLDLEVQAKKMRPWVARGI